MAAQETGSVSNACLCVLCGLPAAGKSTLARKIFSTAAQSGWRVTVVPYDDLIPERAFRIRAEEESSVKLQEMHTEWKLHRQAVLLCIEQFLMNPEVPQSSSLINSTAWEQCIQALQPHGLKADHAPLLFLLDDNFYYPSMRYEVCQLARKRLLGFCQVYLQCDRESCISRNQSRCQPIPTEVIEEMVKRLESPNPQKNSWEKNSISLNAADSLSECDFQRVMDLISSALSNPLSPAEDNTEQKEADRLKCANSVVHQADQACRRLVSEAMKTAKENQSQPEHMRSLAAQLNESKATFLHDLRKQVLQEVPYIEEDTNVEHIVKKAIEIFEEKKNEILSRTISEHK
ncbi:L-seryl-tRNA(Sec) kinase [Parambassis ranga]|uniref:L-seryl-tRNA(Sec) kinase n=1 Tax=Parambassis ranga TaxID=210632 RepID=A0A6P7KDU7_9TELE|nr:L-seryl-tRNA(Sec) kinase [Parambassis ranga]